MKSKKLLILTLIIIVTVAALGIFVLYMARDTSSQNDQENDMKIIKNTTNESTIEELTIDEIFEILCNKLNLNKEKFEYTGKDEYGGYEFTYVMSVGEPGNPQTFVVNPQTGTIYDYISGRPIENIFSNKKMEEEDIQEALLQNYINDKEIKTSLYGYNAGNIIISTYKLTKEEEYIFLEDYEVNPFTLEVYIYNTGEYLGKLE